MRGSQLFRKFITTKGSGWHRWKVIDQYGAVVGTGEARTVKDARQAAREAERAALPNYRTR